MTAADIARALDGRRSGDGYTCRCPVPGHGKRRGDRLRSLSVRDGETTVLIHCFGGCDPRDVLNVLRQRGLFVEDGGRPRTTPRTSFPPRPVVHAADPEALTIWHAAAPGEGSLIETYLHSRGITSPVPLSLRCGERAHLGRYVMPAMVAAVQVPDGKIVAVQTTLLTLAGRKAPVSVPRLTVGALGEGAIRLAAAGDVLGIAEGVETALSAMQLSGVPCWACLGAARMHRVVIPASVSEFHIFADNDEPGRAAAERAAHAHRHRRVVLRFPPADCKDWNDTLLAAARAAA